MICFPGKRKKQKLPAGCRKAVRKLILVAAVLVALLCGMITAQAFGVDVFGALGRWTDEVFHFGSSAQAEAVVRRYPMALDEEVEYASLQEAMEAFGIGAPIAPQWIPERFREETYFNGTVTPSGALIGAEYYSGTDYLSISFQEVDEDSGFIIEKDDRPPKSYMKNNYLHFILYDQEYLKVLWQNGDIVGLICGKISEQEATRIIDSIYE